jgi:hypothetical protein
MIVYIFMEIISFKFHKQQGVGLELFNMIYITHIW